MPGRRYDMAQGAPWPHRANRPVPRSVTRRYVCVMTGDLLAERLAAVIRQRNDPLGVGGSPHSQLPRSKCLTLRTQRSNAVLAAEGAGEGWWSACSIGPGPSKATAAGYLSAAGRAPGTAPAGPTESPNRTPRAGGRRVIRLRQKRADRRAGPRGRDDLAAIPAGVG